eukprot:332216-Pelagomonas_calceolata.AAC.2
MQRLCGVHKLLGSAFSRKEKRIKRRGYARQDRLLLPAASHASNFYISFNFCTSQSSCAAAFGFLHLQCLPCIETDFHTSLSWCTRACCSAALLPACCAWLTASARRAVMSSSKPSHKNCMKDEVNGHG